jgi:hypothetical protein
MKLWEFACIIIYFSVDGYCKLFRFLISHHCHCPLSKIMFSTDTGNKWKGDTVNNTYADSAIYILTK